MPLPLPPLLRKLLYRNSDREVTKIMILFTWLKLNACVVRTLNASYGIWNYRKRNEINISKKTAGDRKAIDSREWQNKHISTDKFDGHLCIQTSNYRLILLSIDIMQKLLTEQNAFEIITELHFIDFQMNVSTNLI